MANAESGTPSTSPTNPRRREWFFRWLTYAMGAAATAILGIPVVGYLLGALRKHRIVWVGLGPPGRFPANETRLATFRNPLGEPWDGMAAEMGVYVRNLGPDDRGADQFQVFAMNCAHLGCPVTWFPQSGLFMCPCHGGVYYAERRTRLGAAAAGPVSLRLAHPRWPSWRSRLPTCPTLQDTLDKPANA